MAISENKHIDGIIHQKCTRCNEWKPADDDHYGRSKQDKIGFSQYCRVCMRETRQIYFEKSYEHLRVRKKQYAPIPLDSPTIKKSPLPIEFKLYFSHITSDLESQARYKAYLITCKTTKRHYVGITERKLEARWMQHLREANKQGGYLLHQIISQYGIWDFEFKYVASAKTRKDLHELEKQLIRQYDSVENGYNQTRGGSNSESVGNPVIVNGVQFISINSAARHYGIEEYSVHQRMKRYGFTLEEALEVDSKQKLPPKRNIYEVEGHIYPNFTEACRQYGLEDSAVRSRLKNGWSKRQAFGLEMPPKIGRNTPGKSITVNGEVFSTLASSANAHGIKSNVFRLRLKRGWSLDQALGIEPPPPPCGEKSGEEITVNGVTYSSQSKAANAYGLNGHTVRGRLSKGWTVGQAFGLELPPQRNNTTGKQVTIEGVTYSSLKKAANAYNLNSKMVRKRIVKLGWSIEQAFGLATPSKKPNSFAKKVEIHGVAYESINRPVPHSISHLQQLSAV